MHGLVFLMQLNMCTETVVRTEYMYLFQCSSFPWLGLPSATGYVHWNSCKVWTYVFQCGSYAWLVLSSATEYVHWNSCKVWIYVHISVQFLFMGLSFFCNWICALKQVVCQVSLYFSAVLIYGLVFLVEQSSSTENSGQVSIYFSAAFIHWMVFLVEQSSTETVVWSQYTVFTRSS